MHLLRAEAVLSGGGAMKKTLDDLIEMCDTERRKQPVGTDLWIEWKAKGEGYALLQKELRNRRNRWKALREDTCAECTIRKDDCPRPTCNKIMAPWSAEDELNFILGELPE